MQFISQRLRMIQAQITIRRRYELYQSFISSVRLEDREGSNVLDPYRMRLALAVSNCSFEKAIEMLVKSLNKALGAIQNP